MTMNKGQLLTWVSEHEYVEAHEMVTTFIVNLDAAHENLVALHNEGYLGAMSAENDSTLFGISVKGKEYLLKELMFFKVYQDKELISDNKGYFYVDPWKNIEEH